MRCLWKCELIQSLWETVWQCLSQARPALTVKPSIFPVGNLSRIMIFYTHTKTSAYSESIFIRKNQKLLKATKNGFLSFNGLMIRQTAVHPYHEVSLINPSINK